MLINRCFYVQFKLKKTHISNFRYVVYSTNRYVVVNVSGFDVLYVYLGDCNVTGLTGGNSTDTSADTILKAVRASSVTTAGNTAVGASAFYNCYALSSVVIPNGETSIGASAFYGCRSLSSVVIPNGVTSIGENAFQYCYALSSVTVPSGYVLPSNVSFSDSKYLSQSAIKKMAENLGATTTARTITFHATVKSKIPADVIALFNSKKYTIA